MLSTLLLGSQNTYLCILFNRGTQDATSGGNGESPVAIIQRSVVWLNDWASFWEVDIGLSLLRLKIEWDSGFRLHTEISFGKNVIKLFNV